MLVEEEELEAEVLMAKIYKIQTKLKLAAFGKTKPQTAKARTKQKEAALKELSSLLSPFQMLSWNPSA